MSAATTVRDLELLRTLLRVRFANTHMLVDMFFTNARLARRRLQVLRERSLIAAHDKGLSSSPGGVRYWRLTQRGIETVARAFPREAIPENVLARTCSASLRNFEHRNAITELYLGMVADRRNDAHEVGRRADAVTWHSEYDLELRYEACEGAAFVERRIVPDSTLELGSRRIFLEVDRSTETVKRCVRAVQAYQQFLATSYAETFGDERDAHILYVTRSSRRTATLSRAFRAAVADAPVSVLPHARSVQWLSELVRDAVDPASASSPAAVEPERHMLQVLRDLYELVRGDIARRQEAGEPVSVPQCLHHAYALLDAEGLSDAIT